MPSPSSAPSCSIRLYFNRIRFWLRSDSPSLPREFPARNQPIPAVSSTLGQPSPSPIHLALPRQLENNPAHLETATYRNRALGIQHMWWQLQPTSGSFSDSVHMPTEKRVLPASLCRVSSAFSSKSFCSCLSSQWSLETQQIVPALRIQWWMEGAEPALEECPSEDPRSGMKQALNSPPSPHPCAVAGYCGILTNRPICSALTPWEHLWESRLARNCQWSLGAESSPGWWPARKWGPQPTATRNWILPTTWISWKRTQSLR